MPKYTFYSDAGHGWLKVPMVEVISLGIAGRLSTYSYQHNGNVFLEEDCDMGIFVLAKTNIENVSHWCKDNIKDVYQEHTPIRGYPHYQPRDH